MGTAGLGRIVNVATSHNLHLNSSHVLSQIIIENMARYEFIFVPDYNRSQAQIEAGSKPLAGKNHKPLRPFGQYNST